MIRTASHSEEKNELTVLHERHQNTITFKQQSFTRKEQLEVSQCH